MSVHVPSHIRPEESWNTSRFRSEMAANFVSAVIVYDHDPRAETRRAVTTTLIHLVRAFRLEFHNPERDPFGITESTIEEVMKMFCPAPQDKGGR